MNDLYLKAWEITNYQIKIQDRTEISRYSHSSPEGNISNPRVAVKVVDSLTEPEEQKKSWGQQWEQKEALIKPLRSDWNPPELCILSSSCKSERQNSRPENEFKRSWSVNAPIFKSICIIIPAFTSFLNKFSNISGMYFKNTQHTYEKEAEGNNTWKKRPTGPLLSITYF